MFSLAKPAVPEGGTEGAIKAAVASDHDGRHPQLVRAARADST